MTEILKSDIRNKKILLFAPQGKGIYGSAIYNELIHKGAVVNIYNERVSTSTVSKIIYRVAKELVRSHFTSYISNIIKERKNEDFDYILIIRGEAFSPIEIKLLREAYPHARLILYLWDSFKNNDVQSLLPLFDKTLSFDLQDCENNKTLIFRPLFFTDNYRKISSEKDFSIDLLFVGTVHSERFLFYKRMEEYLLKHNYKLHSFMYFPSRLLYLKKKLNDPSFKGCSMSDFNYKMMPATEASNLMAQSKAALDMQSPTQTGLTMRTIEVFGAKRKLITTNQQIKKYDFFNEKNIMLIDLNFKDIDLTFFETPFQELPEDIYEKYSLSYWIDEVFAN